MTNTAMESTLITATQSWDDGNWQLVDDCARQAAALIAVEAVFDDETFSDADRENLALVRQYTPVTQRGHLLPRQQ